MGLDWIGLDWDGMGWDGMDLRVGGGIEHLTVLIILFSIVCISNNIAGGEEYTR